MFNSMKDRIGFAFDLHGTLVLSNEAWVDAFVSEIGDETYRSEIKRMVYLKASRRDIARKYSVAYESVLEKYFMMVEPDCKMVALVKELARVFPVYLVSSASPEKVKHDVESISLDRVFSKIYDGENFCKGSIGDWEKLIQENDLDMLVYIGNDIDEDLVMVDKLCVLLSGNFMAQLNNLGFLYKREWRDKL